MSAVEGDMQLGELVTILADRLMIPVQIHQNPSKTRPLDYPQIVGSNEKIRTELGWHPHINLADSLQEMSTFWKNRLLREQTGIK